MPIFEFKCINTDCNKYNKIKEILVMKKDEEVQFCENCVVKMKRYISTSNFHLKGGGWCKEGYGNKKPTMADGPKFSK